MRLLLDTHALIWWLVEPEKLSPSACSLIEEQEAFISAASVWEISTKHRLGKLPQLGPSLGSDFLTILKEERLQTLPVEDRHALRAGGYRVPHGDPFDRLLAATSELEAMPLLTRDPAFAAFPCETRW
jgi:PIN domain nuclease of toxin-antitoxin system